MSASSRSSGLRRASREAKPDFRKRPSQIAPATFGRPGPPAVLDAGRTNAILDAFADTWSTKIIRSTIERAKTVGEIYSEQGLPQSSCYKRIKRLVSQGLMIVEERILTEDGKKSATYRSAFSYVSVRMVDGKVDVQVTFNPGVIEKLDDHRRGNPS